MTHIKRWEVTPHLKFINKFFDHPLFISTFAEIGQKYLSKNKYDHILFSYHGLPERQIKKAAVKNYCQLSDQCCSIYHQKNSYCYRAQCYATTRLLAEKLGLDKKQYSLSFQSRLGKTPWIRPYTDQVLVGLAKDGVKNILVFSPAFVADCLETTVEIAMEYAKLWRDNGGQHLQLVESLNTHRGWIDCLKNIILQSERSLV